MTHYVASRMARRHGIPWVADFRDLPDQYLKQTWADRRCVQCEIRICKHARVMVAVSQPQADVLVSRHGVPVYVIPNGYDPEDYPLESDVKFPKFNIGYFGSVYADRDSRALFMAIDRLASQSDVDLDDMLIQFYGAGEDCLSAMKAGFRCAGIVQCLPRVAHTEMIRLQQRCVILLVLSHKTSTGLMTAKIFDYMGARRPILDVPGGGVTGAVLEETRTGVGAESPKEIAKVLQRWYEEWKGTGTVAYRGIPGKIARYTRKEQAGQLAQIFDGLAMAR
jgi:glycosyltransferase involved in cell wall biosynthesis